MIRPGLYIFFAGLITGFCVFWLLFSNCNKGKSEVVKTTIRYIPVKDTSEKYEPKISFIESAGIPQHIDTTAILKNHFSKMVYIDTGKTKYGFYYIHDTVTQNKIIARQVITDFNIPEITKVVEEKRNQLYLGFSAIGRKDNLLSGFGPSLMLKLKSDKIIEFGALYGMDGKINYQASLKFKISFHH
jgi:hypothetical protein